MTNDTEPDWRVRITPVGIDEWFYLLQTKDPDLGTWEGLDFWSDRLGLRESLLRGWAPSMKKARKEAERVIDRVKAAWKHQHGVRAYVDSDKNIHFQ